MTNQLNLLSGQKYKVIKPFTDYDRDIHPIGETWTFVETNFLPYEDGLTVHIRFGNDPKVTLFRLQLREEEQADLIHSFGEYVEAVG
jgi:hypothetical protein